MINKLKSIWARYWLRNSTFTGRYGSLKNIYAVKDPWSLNTTKEIRRFSATNDLILSTIPDCKSLLELGCGEGYQTEFLSKVSRSTTGLDISEKATARARALCPDVEFVTGRAEDLANLFPGRKFDLVTACEILYYSNNVQQLLGEIMKISDRLLVTNFSERAELMRSQFEGPGWHRLDDIEAEGTRWECHLWKRP
jgi:ubiquinone/menaquinone biosynthesis C-methylase UbiE